MTELASSGAAPRAALALLLAACLIAPWLIWARTPAARAAFERFTRQLGPALTAALVTAGYTDQATTILCVFVIVLLVAERAVQAPPPLRLMPLARLALVIAVPLLSTCLIALAAGLGYISLSRSALLGLLLWTSGSMAVGHLLEEVFDDHWLQRVAILGDARFAGRLTSDLTAAATHGYCVLGYVCETDGGSGRAEEGSSCWLGSVTDLNRIVAEHRVDVLVLAPGRHSATEIAQTIVCQQADVRIVSAASFYEVQGQVPIGMIDASWLELGHHRVSHAFHAVKRGVDLVVCFLLAPLVVPAMAMIALTIALRDGRPVLYRQLRVGERGQEFWLLKFRSMRVDAESDGLPVWAVGNDPRATPLGAFLRRSHLDELPQLLNVLKGEMSIVGPRPERPAFVAQLAERYPFYRPRLIVKPGVTGWAQLRCGYAGSDAGSGRKLCADLYYIKHRSLLLDFLIMVETARTLFVDRAYAYELDGAGVVNFSDSGR